MNDPLDTLVSQYVRERDNWTCQKCGRGRESCIDAAHIMARRHKATRYDPENLLSLCRECHSYFTAHPLYFAVWVKEKIGADKFDELLQRARKAAHLKKMDISELRKSVNAMLKDLRRARRFNVKPQNLSNVKPTQLQNPTG